MPTIGELAMNDKKEYRIAYRTGGTENFTWHCIAGKHSGHCLHDNRMEIERMGYPTAILADGDPLPNFYTVAGWDDGRCKRTHIKCRDVYPVGECPKCGSHTCNCLLPHFATL